MLLSEVYCQLDQYFMVCIIENKSSKYVYISYTLSVVAYLPAGGHVTRAILT